MFDFESLFGAPGAAEILRAALAEEVRRNPGTRRVIVSAENLFALKAAPALFAGLDSDYDIEVLAYIRRQDDYLLSSWQQWYSKVFTDFWGWLVTVVGTLGNWQDYVQRWEVVVPFQRIHLRVFERSKLAGGDVVQDFFEWLDSGLAYDQMEQAQRTINPASATRWWNWSREIH